MTAASVDGAAVARDAHHGRIAVCAPVPCEAAIAAFAAAIDSSARELEAGAGAIREMLVAIERAFARAAAFDSVAVADSIISSSGIALDGPEEAGGTRHVVLALSPDVLGGSTVYIDLAGGDLSIAIDPANAAVATLAAGNASALRRAVESRCRGAFRRVSVSVKKGSSR